jgi:mycofactocin system glycosyltransferase
MSGSLPLPRANPGPVPAAPPAARTPLPQGFRLEPDIATLRMQGDRVLLGGSPLRLLRLRPKAAELAGRWAAGEPVGSSPAEQLLARRLVSTGMFVPRPPAGGLSAADVTVVVPVRDRPAMLGRLLSALGSLRVVVVDDASVDPEPVAAVARAAGATYLQMTCHAGPAAARNAGLAEVGTPLVAFVDSDCVPEKGWLEPLLDELADPRVAAVAPRVLPAGAETLGVLESGEPGGRPHPVLGWLSRYEAVRSPLDRGPRPGVVRPGARVPFVPTAALLARRCALGEPCFDESLAGGEDVDLVWRLTAAGWDVRYQPAATVRHAQRPSLAGWAGRRVFYGTTAGPLAERHGAALAPVSISAWSAASLLLLLARRPLAAVLVDATAVGILSRRLRKVVGDPLALALRIAGLGTLRAVLSSMGGLARAWGPAAALGLVPRRTRGAAAATLLAPAAADWWALEPGTRPGPVGYVMAHVADDVAYGLGVWLGAARRRTLRPLLPQVVLRSRTWTTDTLRRRVDA